ncbi:MAG: NUDIX domain-containing protein [Nitrococcus sp.]|nr:NUDIX domain-containing protein [Nitrococcus sp.]
MIAEADKARTGRRGRPIRVLSAGVAVVREVDGDWHFLLLRAFQYWDFPKGQVERDEQPLAAAQREVTEETGITELRFHWGHGYIETGPYAQGKLARYYLAETTQIEIELGISPQLGRPEHHEYRWVNLDEAIRLTSPRVRRVLHWVRQRLNAPSDK